MIKILLAFVIVFFAMYFGISQYRSLSGKEKWDLAKMTGYSALCAFLAIGLLMIIVVLF